ncbi:MAG: hypothetical protein Tsb0019_23640 [Roseibium sp.]
MCENGWDKSGHGATFAAVVSVPVSLFRPSGGDQTVERLAGGALLFRLLPEADEDAGFGSQLLPTRTGCGR